MTLDALRTVVLPGGERIATLIEVLDYCTRENLLVNVEVKRDVPSRRRATAAIAACLRGTGCDVLVSSFDPFMLAGALALAPRVPRALLLSPDHPYLDRVANRLRCVAIHPFHELVHASRVRAWQARGLRVNTWTVNELEHARALVELGVDGIITDDPGALSPLIV